MSFFRYIFILGLALIMPIFSAYANISSSQRTLPESNNFIAISDIHFNPFASCQINITPCPAITELNKADPSHWENILAKYDNGAISANGSDTNYPLLKSALAAAHQQTLQAHPKFVLIPGDFLAHNFKANYRLYSHSLSQTAYQNFVKKTFQFLTIQLQKTFLNTPIYPVIGNNDSYTDNYIVLPNGTFFKDLTSLWFPMLGKYIGTFRETFPVAGYYSLTPAHEPRLRVIVLNTVLFAKPGSNAAKNAGLKELEWLKIQLQSAQQQQQKALLVFHIPVGINFYNTVKDHNSRIVSFWLPSYTKQFLNLLNQYHDVISGLIAGHIHMDGFQIINAKSSPILNTTVPAISPIYGNNPGFKVYSYAEDTLILQNFVTYFLNGNMEKDWQKEYDFNKIYQPNCQHCKLIDGMKKLKPEGTLTYFYQNYFAVSSNLFFIIKINWLPYCWCSIYNITSADYQNCLKANH